MKKSILFIFIFAITALYVFIPNQDAVYAAKPTYLSAHGTATIDGIKDAVYEQTMLLEFGNPRIAKSKTYVVWDANNLYIFSEVYDSSVYPTSPEIINLWFSDSVEIFIDRLNQQANWTSDDFQLRVDNQNIKSGMNSRGQSLSDINSELLSIMSAVEIVSYGYNVEIKLPLSNDTAQVTGAENKEIGFDIQVNNINAYGNARDGYVTWCGGGNSSPAGWGTLKMVMTVPEELRIPTTTDITITGGENIAKNKIALLQGATARQPEKNVLDGSVNTVTQSFQNVLYNIVVDLFYEVYIDKIRVYMPDGSYASSFALEYYDSYYKMWVEVYRTDGYTPGTWVETQFDEALTRYVRFVSLEKVGGGNHINWAYYGFAVSEIEVYSSKDYIVTLPVKTDSRGLFETNGQNGELPISDNGYKVYKEFKKTNINSILNLVFTITYIVGFATVAVFVCLIIVSSIKRRTVK